MPRFPDTAVPISGHVQMSPDESKLVQISGHTYSAPMCRVMLLVGRCPLPYWGHLPTNGLEGDNMKAKITYMWGAWPTYSVERREDCKDEVDRSAYDAFVRSGGRVVQMGKVCVNKPA